MDKLEAINFLLNQVKSRWQRGIRIFKNNPTRVAKKDKTICTAVHGHILVEKEFIPLLDSFFIQRLRNISQMGLLQFVYPEARHSRFDHSLGVYWILKRILDTPLWIEFFKSKNTRPLRKVLLHAALLHDIGHGPFSHLSEQLLEWYNLDKALPWVRKESRSDDKGAYHERKAEAMIREKDFQTAWVSEEYGFSRYLNIDEIDRISNWIVGDGEPLRKLINSSLDVDKLDYFIRDAFFTGTKGGGIDVDFLLRNIIPLKKGENYDIAINEKAVNPYFQLIMGREFVYATTVYHPVACVVQAMLMVAFDHAITKISSKEKQRELVKRIDMLEDADLFWLLETIADCGGTAEYFIDALKSRSLYSILASFTYEEGMKAWRKKMGKDIVKTIEGFMGKSDKELRMKVLEQVAMEDEEVVIKKYLRNLFNPLRYLVKEEVEGLLGITLPDERDVLILAIFYPLKQLSLDKCRDAFRVKVKGEKSSRPKELLSLLNEINMPLTPERLLSLRKSLTRWVVIGPKRLGANGLRMKLRKNLPELIGKMTTVGKPELFPGKV